MNGRDVYPSQENEAHDPEQRGADCCGDSEPTAHGDTISIIELATRNISLTLKMLYYVVSLVEVGSSFQLGNSSGP